MFCQAFSSWFRAGDEAQHRRQANSQQANPDATCQKNYIGERNDTNPNNKSSSFLLTEDARQILENVCKNYEKLTPKYDSWLQHLAAAAATVAYENDTELRAREAQKQKQHERTAKQSEQIAATAEMIQRLKDAGMATPEIIQQLETEALGDFEMNKMSTSNGKSTSREQENTCIDYISRDHYVQNAVDIMKTIESDVFRYHSYSQPTKSWDLGAYLKKALFSGEECKIGQEQLSNGLIMGINSIGCSLTSSKLLYHVCGSEKSNVHPVTNPSINDMLLACQRFALASVILRRFVQKYDLDDSLKEDLKNAQSLSPPSNLIKSFTDFCFEDNGNTTSATLDQFMKWQEKVGLTLLSQTLSTFMGVLVFQKSFSSLMEDKQLFSMSDLQDRKSSLIKPSPCAQELFCLSCISHSIGDNWICLYTSEGDEGMTFNRLHQSLVGYGGPTVLLVKSTRSKEIFGAFTSQPWKDSSSFHGNQECFLFQIFPLFKIFRPKSSGSGRYMYCSASDIKKAPPKGVPQEKVAYGLGFGGTYQQPRLWITETLENCVAHFRDSTFEDGFILSPTSQNETAKNRCNFDVDILEVWGTGGDRLIHAALSARKNYRDIIDANIQKSRQVDKKQFMNDLNSGLIESKAFAHREQIRGRAEKCYEVDDHRK